MPTLLDVDEVREHVESDLTDPALILLVEDADAEIISRLGVLDAENETFAGGGALLHLRRKAAGITSVDEKIGSTTTPLTDGTDFELLADGFQVRRLVGGAEARWQGIVVVAYEPVDETARRKRLLVDLVKLAVAYDAVRGLAVGDVRKDHVDYQQERENLFRALLTAGRRLPFA